VISTVDVNTGVSVTRQESFAPSETETGAGDERVSVTRRYPFNAVISWRDNGALLTDFEYSRSSNVDSVPGSSTLTRSSTVGLRVTRSFAMPQSWRMRSKLRATFGWRKERSSSYISVQNSPEPSRLADNGSTRLDLNAESELAPQLRFSLLGSRVVTFDNNYNRKFSQFFLTAAFSFIFQTGGEIAR
jgi:hypothetical protein